jgi:hypothetical protein
MDIILMNSEKIIKSIVYIFLIFLTLTSHCLDETML